MKNVTPSHSTALAPRIAFDLIGAAIDAALADIESARTKCFVAGQYLIELKQALPDGQFLDVLAQRFPQISRQTAATWMRAAANFTKALPLPDTIDISVSMVLTLPDAELSAEALQWKQQMLDLFGQHSIREATAGVFVDGDPDSRVDRCLNGKLKGGAGSGDRKAVEVFTGRKLSHITTFLTVQERATGSGQKVVRGWREISPVQQAKIGTAFTQFIQTAPPWLLGILADQVKQELKLNDAERLARA